MRALSPFWTKSIQPATDFWSEVDRIFDDMSLTPTKFYDERQFQPRAELTESDDKYFLSMDLPGLKKEEIKIEVQENVLSVSGERKREKRADEKSSHAYEKLYGFFKRSFTLPRTALLDQIEAKYEHGVLELVIPKTAQAQIKKIDIR